MDRQRAMLALQRRQQQPEVEILPPRPVHHRKPITLSNFAPDTIAISAVLICAIVGFTIIGIFLGLRGIIYELRRNPDASTCLFNCNE